MAQSFTFTVTDPDGIHARPASELVAKCQTFSSTVHLALAGHEADAKSILAVMGLGARNGDTLNVSVDGDDEQAAAAQLETFFKENL